MTNDNAISIMSIGKIIIIIKLVTFCMFFLNTQITNALNISVYSDPPQNSVITTNTEVSVNVEITREGYENPAPDVALYSLVASFNNDITIQRSVGDPGGDCRFANTTQGRRVLSCLDKPLGRDGRSYQPLLVFKAKQPNTTVTVNILFQDLSRNPAIAKSFSLSFPVRNNTASFSCETNPANGGAKCFSGSACSDPIYSVLLTGPDAQCGPSQVCCQKQPENDYDCDRLDIARIDCKQFDACMPPEVQVKCAPSCEYGFQVAPVGGRGCQSGNVCCFRWPVPNNGCTSNYGSHPYFAECRPYCSNDKPFLINTAHMGNASCPGKDGMPQVCCTATAVSDPLPENLCVYGNFPDGRQKLGIMVPFGNGCIPALSDIVDFSAYVFYWSGGIAGLVSLILIIYSGFMIMTSKGDAKKVQAGKELLTATITGLSFFIFSAFVLRIIIADILNIIR